MKPVSSLALFFGILGLVAVSALAEERIEADKRYLAALAKNGRLPKFAYAQKKDDASKDDDSEEDLPRLALQQEDKRHVGAFLKAHGRPVFGDGKRNVASMARLGRLNALRFARMQPYSVGGKRMGEPGSANDEDNALALFEDPDCLFAGEGEEEEGGPMEKKRYVAALARTGRLPIWHSQRMWGGGKRDESARPFFGDARLRDVAPDENSLGAALASPSRWRRRCKTAGGGQEEEKRNVAALAKNGKLPFRQGA